MEEAKSEEEIENEEEGKENTEALKNQTPKIKYNQKCPKHNKILHSYVKASKELLCNQCIFERKIPPNQIEIIPQAIKDIKHDIESTRIMILYRKN